MNYLILFLTILIIGTANASELTCAQHAANLIKEADRIEYMKYCSDPPHNQPHQNKQVAAIESKSDEIVAKIALNIAKFNQCTDMEVHDITDNVEKKYERHAKLVNDCAVSAAKL